MAKSDTGAYPVQDGVQDTVQDPEDVPDPRRRRRRLTAAVVGAGLLVAAVAVVGNLGLGGGGSDQDPKAPARAGSLVPVARKTLAERVTVDGRLGYGTEVPLPVKAQGTVTWLPRQGTTVARGGTLLRVDDRPVVLMYGTLPMYRPLGPTTETPGQDGGTGQEQDTGDGKGADATAPPTATQATPQDLTGMDVMQFETNLAALGYTGFTVDERFTDATARAVERWQQHLGLPQTGTVGIGDVVYSAGKVRIGHAGVRLGGAAGDNALSCTGTARKVTVNASAADAAWAVRGTSVTVTLPNGTSVPGTVASVGRQASASEGDGGDGGGAQATLPVTVTLADQKALGRLESGPVTVEYVGRKAKNVLSVPVAALVALAEGGYGLETADGRFVRVRPGLFADGDVEVSGADVREGMKVRIPE